MIRFVKVGKKIHYGLNIYPWSQRKWHIGFKLKYWKNKVFAVRYSRTAKKLFVDNITAYSTNGFMEALK